MYDLHTVTKDRCHQYHSKDTLNKVSQCPKMYKQQKLGNKMESDIENSRLFKAQTGQTIKKLR